MKIDRLIGILSILLQQDKVTAPYLAEKFEVSRRTINRDIENLCMAGIPIVTTQGVGGGISIMDGYRMDKTLLTTSDMQAILTGLRGLDSISGTRRYEQLMDKLSVEESSVLASTSHVMIDLTSWYKSSLQPKITCIQDAIDQGQLVQFTYYSPGGETVRQIEPYLLIFQWSSWYLWGYCRLREDYRMFKMNRIQDLQLCEETFVQREHPPFEADARRIFPPRFDAVARFDAQMKWRLVEEYGLESFMEQPDGSLLFQAGFMDKQSLFGWLMTFGDTVELLEPADYRVEFAGMINHIARRYCK